MPPVNTYGLRKKKRRGIPKCIFQNADNVFEALKIDNFKETKAIIDAKHKARAEKRAPAPLEFERLHISTDAADSTFDRLLREGPINACMRNFCSDSSSNSSGAANFSVGDVLEFPGGCRSGHPTKPQVFKKSVKANRLKKNDPRVRKRHAERSGFFGNHSETSLPALEASLLLKENCILREDAVAGINVTSAENVCRTPVLREKNEKGLLGISPILPLPPVRGGSSSTPCEKAAFSYGDLCPELKSGGTSRVHSLGDEVFQDIGHNTTIDLFFSSGQIGSEDKVLKRPENNGSSDMFASLDQQELSSTGLNNGVHSVDILDSHENDGMNFNVSSGHVLSKPTDGTNVSVTHEASKSIYVCSSIDSGSSVDIIESSQVHDLASCLGDCKLASSSDSDSDFLINRGEVAPNTKRCSIVTKNCQTMPSKFDCAPNQLPSSGVRSFQESVSSLNDSPGTLLPNTYSPPNLQGVRPVLKSGSVDDCFVVLTRCDIPNDSRDFEVDDMRVDSVMHERTEWQRSNGEDTSCDTAVQQGSGPSLLACEVSRQDLRGASEEKECWVVLSRCDDMLLRKSLLNSEVKHPCEDTVSSVDISGNFQERDSVGRCISSRRSDANVDSLILIPGKQWRRSLSILSKVRTSCGESSAGYGQPMAQCNKMKGKLWGSRISSLIQLQPASETIVEDWEASVRSLEVESNYTRQSIEHLGHDKSAISGVPEQLSLESDASRVYKRCLQEGPVPFSKFFPSSMKKNCKKIGEGVYGEVFFFSGSAHRAPSVIKIIPIEGKMEVNGEPQKTFREIISEVIVAQELSNLRKGVLNATSTFNKVQAIRCVQGCYPNWLQALWHDFDDSKGSENDSPEIFQEDQLYIVLELSNGGKDLESFVFSSADQGLAAFKQVALALAVAEEAVEFEHRDLHWGNVLISNTKEKEINYILNGETHYTATKGIEASIIDFTLSRISDPVSKQPVFYDLARDETLFAAEGDYQFDIYRMMKEFNENKWDTFVPKSNVAWLHYLLDKLCTMARYKNRTTKVHNRAISVLSKLKDSVLMFDNVSSFVKCDGFSK